MNKVQRRIYNEIVAPAMNNIAGIRLAVIRDISYENKMCSVAYNVQQDAANMEITNVPMLRQQGTHESGPFVGDTVLIGFFNNDSRKPVILGTLDMAYKARRTEGRDKHDGKGAHISDLYCDRKGESWNVE